MTLAILALAAAIGSAGPSAVAERRARELAKQSMVAYDLGRFRKALGLAEKAYELDQRPGLLFNLAQCHRALEHWKQAAFFYRGYLRGRPDAENHDAVVALIAEMEARDRQVGATAARPVPAGAPAPSQAETPVPCVVAPAQLGAWPPGAMSALSPDDCFHQQLAQLDAQEKEALELDPHGQCGASSLLRADFDRLRSAQAERRTLNEGTQAAMQDLARRYRTEHHSLFEASNEPSPTPLTPLEWAQLDQAYAAQGRSADGQANLQRLVELVREVAALKQKLADCVDRQAHPIHRR